METKDWVLLVLAVVGGVVAVRGLVLDYRRRAGDKWNEQQSVDRLDFVNDLEAATGYEAAIAKRGQRDASSRVATGRGLDEDTPSPTRTETSGQSVDSRTG